MVGISSRTLREPEGEEEGQGEERRERAGKSKSKSKEEKKKKKGFHLTLPPLFARALGSTVLTGCQ